MAKERHAFEECIQNLTRELQGLSNEKEGLLEIRAFTRQHKPQQNDKQIHELQEQLYVAHQKAITAQEEVQAKTAQVKQYKKKDDQREEKLISLDVRNQELVQEMERVRSELIKAKTESANLLKEEKKLNQNEMKKICLELERALKKTSKSKAHDELLKVELVNNSLRVDKERLSGSLQEVQEQFARLKLEVTNTIPTTPPTYTESTIPIQPNQVSVKHDTPQGRSSHPTAIPRPDPNNEHSIAQQPPTMPNVNIVPQATQDNYNPQPEARLVPNSPTEGRSSMNFDDPRPAYDRVEVNGFRNAAGQNERQSSTGPQPDNSIRYPPGLQVKQSHSSAPSSTNLALSEQAASPTDALNRMSLILGDQQLERPSNIPSDFSQSQYPANTHQGGGYQDPVSNYQGQSGFDNLPQDQYQNQYMHQNQPRRESPSMHRHPSQWPNHDRFHQMEVTNTTTQPPIPIQNVGHSDGSIHANMETSAQVCEALEGGVADCHSLIKRLQDGVAAFKTNREVFMKVTGERDRLLTETNGQREIIATIQHELKIKEEKRTSLAEETERVRVDLQLALNKCAKLLASLKQCREESEQSIAEVRGRCEQETDRRIKQERQARRVFKQLDRRVKEPVVLSPSKGRKRDESLRTYRQEVKAFTVNSETPIQYSDRNRIGSGSFGSVYAVNLNGAPCIAKRLHDILMGRGKQEKVALDEKQVCHEKFCRECVLMSQAEHPNVVKFLGVYFGKDEFDLTLFMERLHTDLEAYLSSTPNVPLPTKISILHDVSCGLLYLHEECSIIHRDLTAANILLTADNQAKIADLGVSRIFDRTFLQLSKIPGTLAYMPPEALKNIANYDESLDVFSFGVLTLCVGIQMSPDLSWDHVPDDVHAKGEQEIFKRTFWIEIMEQKQPELISLVLWCLSDDPKSRPSTYCMNVTLQEMKHDL